MTKSGIKNSSWWSRRTRMERFLILLSIIVSIAVIVLITCLCVVLLSEKERNGEENNKQSPETFQGHLRDTKNRSAEICLSPGCVHAAAKILENMDPNVEPCNDFYRFACGGFIRNTIITDDKTSANVFSVIQDEVKSQLRIILEESIRPNEIKPFKLAKNLYKSCMNKSMIESRRFQPLLKALDKVGGWPVLTWDAWNETVFSWQRSVADCRKAGLSIDYFIEFSIIPDNKNSSKRIITLDHAVLGLSREYLIKGMQDRLVSAYYNYMVDIAVILGAPRKRASEELKESILFEIQLANISMPKEERRNATLLYNQYTIAKLQTMYPSISWLEYINALLPKGLSVSKDEEVILRTPKYIQGLERLLNKTSKRVLANYIMWRITLDSISYLTEEIRNRELKYHTELYGVSEKDPEWRECVSIVNQYLPIAVGSLYVRKHFKEDAKYIALEMVNRIRAAFVEILENVDWMDQNTRKSALEKANAMMTHIAYPDELLDEKKLIQVFKDLELDENQYMESVLNIIVFEKDYDFNNLRKPVNKSDWQSHATPSDVNAYYASEENSIKFPAGILQGVFFSANRPQYMNYGAIGYAIGHEITHGFDDQGRQFDKDGNLADWWAPATKDAYLEKAKCIIEQYGNFTDRDVNLNLNGVNTQGENIADNGGVKEAYLAYTKWIEDHGEEPQLPGLKYTPRQMFWLSAANTWCFKFRPETLKIRITTGVHSPGEFRILGPLSNSEDFSKDFGCTLGSPMNPRHKCEVW